MDGAIGSWRFNICLRSKFWRLWAKSPNWVPQSSSHLRLTNLGIKRFKLHNTWEIFDTRSLRNIFLISAQLNFPWVDKIWANFYKIKSFYNWSNQKMSFTKNAVLNFNFSLKIFLERFNHRKWTLKDQCLDFFALFDQSVKVNSFCEEFFFKSSTNLVRTYSQ